MTIYCSDSRNMSELDDGSVCVTVTSPPYRNAMDYDIHSKGEGWYRGANIFTDTNEYLILMQEHFEEVFRVTKEGGFCCIVIGNEIDTSKKCIEPLPALLMPHLLLVGWVMHEEIIWNKVTGGKKRFRVTIQHPFPTYYYPNLMHEHILIMRKGRRLKRKKDDESQFPLNNLWKKEIANSVWHIPPVPPNAGIPHPCPFPDELARRLILVYSKVGDIVLDPFCGSGTTVRVAMALKREGIGYDVNEDYCEYAREEEEEGMRLIDPLIPSWKKWKREPEKMDIRRGLGQFLYPDEDE